MATRRSLTPGWYRDPYEPNLLRHWNGRSWGLVRRRLPPWVVATVDLDAGDFSAVREGPSRRALLPAGPAGAATSAGSTPAAPPLSPATTRQPRPGGSRPGPPGAGRSSSGGASGWTKPRSALTVVVSLLAVAALVMAATVGLARSPIAPTQPSEDTEFVATANMDCATAMDAVRLPAYRVGARVSGPSLAAVLAANRRLTGLMDKLLAIPVSQAARASVQAWLGNWSRFAADRVAEARFVQAHPRLSATALATASEAVNADATQADATALTTGLANCTLSAHPAPGYTQT